MGKLKRDHRTLTGHITMNVQESKAMTEMLERQEELQFRLATGLIKPRKTRNTVLAESTILGSGCKKRKDVHRGRRHAPQVPLPAPPFELGGSHSKPPSEVGTVIRPQTCPEQSSQQGSNRSNKTSNNRNTDNDDAAAAAPAVCQRKRPSTACSGGRRGSGSYVADDSDVRRAVCAANTQTFDILQDPRVLPIACSRPRQLRAVVHPQVDPEAFGAMRARRADMFLERAAHKRQVATRAQHKQLGPPATEGRSNNGIPKNERWAEDERPAGLPASMAANAKRPHSAPTTRSDTKHMEETYGPAARTLPKGGTWKCVRDRGDVLLQGRVQVDTPWALHYQPTDHEKDVHKIIKEYKSKPGSSHSGSSGCSNTSQRRQRALDRLQQHVSVLTAQLADVNHKLEGIEQQQQQQQSKDQHQPSQGQQQRQHMSKQQPQPRRQRSQSPPPRHHLRLKVWKPPHKKQPYLLTTNQAQMYHGLRKKRDTLFGRGDAAFCM